MYDGGVGTAQINLVNQFEENLKKIDGEGRARRGPWQWFMGEGRAWYKQPWRWLIWITIGIPFFVGGAVGLWQVVVALFN